MSTTTTKMTRRPTSKWHPPSPKILNLPRRFKLPSTKSKKPNRCNLPSFFAGENRSGMGNARDNERWRAEALREEYELLRMERDVTLEKLDKTRRKKIDGCDSIEKKMGNLKVRSGGVDGEAHYVREIRQAEESSTSTKNEHEINIKGCKCCCRCKEIVIRIAEEVKAESEQWTEMQGMLDQVRVEMEHLKSSRELWQRRAIDSDFNFRALYPHMVEWKQRARTSENKVIELQKHIFELEKSLRDEAVCLIDFSHSRNLHSENLNTIVLPKIKCQQVEKEKRAPICRRANNSKSNFPRRPPLREIGNLS